MRISNVAFLTVKIVFDILDVSLSESRAGSIGGGRLFFGFKPHSAVSSQYPTRLCVYSWLVLVLSTTQILPRCLCGCIVIKAPHEALMSSKSPYFHSSLIEAQKAFAAYHAVLSSRLHFVVSFK